MGGRGTFLSVSKINHVDEHTIRLLKGVAKKPLRCINHNFSTFWEEFQKLKYKISSQIVKVLQRVAKL